MKIIFDCDDMTSRGLIKSLNPRTNKLWIDFGLGAVLTVSCVGELDWEMKNYIHCEALDNFLDFSEFACIVDGLDPPLLYVACAAIEA